MMKEVCEFWLDRLKALPDGTLVAPNGYSPEHGPREDGVSHDQQLIWDLFTNTIEAADALGIDREFRDTLAAKRESCSARRSADGASCRNGWWIATTRRTRIAIFRTWWPSIPAGRSRRGRRPALAEAARVSLNARGDVSTGWSTAWKINLWAPTARRRPRLQTDRQPAAPRRRHARRTTTTAAAFTPTSSTPTRPSRSTAISATPPASARCSCKVHTGEIQLLPALPKAWPAGSVTGLRARGGFTVDIEWKDGKLTRYRIASPNPREVKVRVGGEVKTVMAERL